MLPLKTDKMLAEKVGPLGWMTFNNVERRNAISVEMWEAIPHIMQAFESDKEIRVIVLKGAGEKAFVAGADVSEFEAKRSDPQNISAYGDLSGQGFNAVLNASKPTIAMIRGYCLGGGLRIALNCDIRIAADDARFSIPAARLGIGYGLLGVRRLMEVVGPAYAQEILFTGRQFEAAEALRMGLINRAVPVTELEADTEEYALRIARNAPLSVAAAKASVRELLKDPADRNLEEIGRMIQACGESEDYKEGRRAFMEKRHPKFEGR